jgi:hypothetical protein
VQLWVALLDHARHIPRAFTHHVPTPSRLAAPATVRVLLGALAGDLPGRHAHRLTPANPAARPAV